MKTINLVKLEHEHLEFENNKFSDNSMEKLKAMLTIREEGHVIYICQPRHLFDSLTENPDTKEINCVDFDSINIEKMIQYNDFGRYSIVEQICSKTNNQFTYLFKKSSHIINKYQSRGLSHLSFPFAILERTYKGYFVRGIINCNKKGISLAFNPIAIKTLPKENIWQKGLRFGDNFPSCN